MPLGLGGLVLMDELNHVPLPSNLFRAPSALVADLIKDVVEVVHGIYDVLNVGLLPSGDRRNVQGLGFEAVVLAAVNAVDVVSAIEGVAEPRVVERQSLLFDGPAVEQHDRHVNTALAGLDDALPHPGEV